MAHFTKLNENNIVTAVYSVHNNELNVKGVESEERGVAFLRQWSGGHDNWKQCSFNGKKRKQYPGIGYLYDSAADVFIAPQPYPSWTLDNKHNWQPPVAKPDGEYEWDEESLSWKEVK